MLFASILKELFDAVDVKTLCVNVTTLKCTTLRLQGFLSACVSPLKPDNTDKSSLLLMSCTSVAPSLSFCCEKLLKCFQATV